MDTELDIQRFFQKVANICALEQAQQEERNRKGENYNLFSILLKESLYIQLCIHTYFVL